MNPVEIGKGSSFKGLAAYLLHDKDNAQTAARVGWAQSFNLDDAEPDRAWRLMAATAMSADQLKEAAGIKKGPPVKNTVWHFSITFNPKDTAGEDVQREAATSALKALGLDKHQALAVMHHDTDHKHVHVMVNLIDPETGLSAASKQPGGQPALLSNTQRKLSRWAAQFERDHGLEITEGRLANANKRAQGEQVDARRQPRNVYEQRQDETTDRRRDYLKRDFDDRATDLAKRGREQREAQAIQWESLKHGYQAEKSATWKDQRQAEKDRMAAIKEGFKPAWAAMFKRQRNEAYVFDRGERSAIGRIWHAAAVIHDRAIDGDLLGGFVAAFSQAERRAIIERRHQQESRRLADQVRQEIALQLKALRLQQAKDREASRLAFLDQCTRLREQQAAEREEMKGHWRQHNAERRQALSQRGRGLERDQGREQGRGMRFGMEP